MGVYRVILVDDHTLFRQALKGLLNGEDDLKVVGEAGDGLELLDLLKSGNLDPHMVILDISMPKLRGLEAIHEIRSYYPDAKILIVTMHNDREYLYESLASGADGYCSKMDAYTELFAAIEKIRKGKIYITPQLSCSMEDGWEQIRKGIDKSVLTKREKEVLKLIAEGNSNKEIAKKLFVSIHTIERHRANIMEKLNINKTADLVKYAIQKGYI